MSRRSRRLLPGQRERPIWWLWVAVVATAMVGAVTAGALALGQSTGEALSWGVLVLVPMAMGLVSGRRQRHDRERAVIGGLGPARQHAALSAYSGRTRTNDPVVARDAVSLMLSVHGDAMASSKVVGGGALGVAVGFAVLAVFGSEWWAVDGVLVAVLGIVVLRQDVRLRARLTALRAVKGRS